MNNQEIFKIASILRNMKHDTPFSGPFLTMGEEKGGKMPKPFKSFLRY